MQHSSCTMQYATWFMNSIAVHARNQQDYYRLHITIRTEGNVNCLSTFALQLLSMWALLMVITTMYVQPIVLSTSSHAVSVMSCCLIGYISWMVTYTCPCTDNNTRIAPVGGIAVMPYRWHSLLSKSKRSISHSDPKTIFRLGTELKSTKHAPILWWNYGGTPLCTFIG